MKKIILCCSLLTCALCLVCTSARADSPAVNELIQDGCRLYDAGNNTAALLAFKKALLADPENTRAQGYIDRIEQLPAAQTQPDSIPEQQEPEHGSIRGTDLPAYGESSILQREQAEVEIEPPQQEASTLEQPAQETTSIPQERVAAISELLTSLELDVQKLAATGIPEPAGISTPTIEEAPETELEIQTISGQTEQPMIAAGSVQQSFDGEPEQASMASGPIQESFESETEQAVVAAEPEQPSSSITIPFPESPQAPAGAEPARKKFILSGKYQVGLGITSDDFLWKDANADYIGVPREKNYRYLWGQDGVNTYDKQIFSRMSLGIKSNFEGPLNGYAEFVNDPWSYIGTSRATTYSTVGGDFVNMKLKYWSGDSRTINEVYRSNKGNIISVDQIKVIKGRTSPATVSGIYDWFTFYDPLDQTDINRDYRFLRKLWVEYKQDNYGIKIFPLSDEYEALTTQDPLRISNNHIYWEESPWLQQYEPSRIFYQDDGTTPIKKGRWVNNLAFVAKDSDMTRLTFLRGASFKTYATEYPFEAVVASPMSLWDDYENASSVEGAARYRMPASDNMDLGFTTTSKTGINRGSLEAVNEVGAVDFEYRINSALKPLAYNKVYGEFAGSYTEIDELLGITTEYSGFAGKLGFAYDGTKEKQGGLLESDIYAGYMEQDFYTALSNYRYTRADDTTWAKHLYFYDLNPKDEVSVFGDGIDRDRFATGLRLKARSFAETINSDARMRYVAQADGEYVETVGRLENTYKSDPESPLTLKSMVYYKHLPSTTADQDPLIYTKSMYSLTDYFSDDDRHPLNTSITNGKDPSIGAFDYGAEYELLKDRVTLEAVYERTNDPLDFPRGLLNDNFVTKEIRDGVLYDKVVPFLYDQQLFNLPPYEYYNIWKSKLIFTPTERWRHVLSYTYNENQYTAGIDDNINHAGLESTYMPTPKWSIWLKYTYSMLKTIETTFDPLQNRDVLSLGKYSGHHNIFIGTEWTFAPDETFTLMYGEFAGYSDPYSDSYWSLATLDTQHIVRLFYRRKF